MPVLLISRSPQLLVLLEAHGHTVRCVTDGQAAEALLQSTRISAVIADLTLPFTGIAFCRKISLESTGTPPYLIGLLPALTPDDISIALAAGAHLCLSSQQSLDDLVMSIDGALRSSVAVRH